MKEPLVSILIPLYNSEKYIAQTIESALNQTYKNIEIIIVNDGSVDKSLEIARRFESECVRVYTQENRGASAARNLAFRESKGELIQYLDSDDLIHPQKIESQVKNFLHCENKNIIMNGLWGRFSEDPQNAIWEVQSLNKNYETPLDWLIDSWNGEGMSQPGTWLIPSSLIEKAGQWNEKLSLNDDGEFFCRVLLNAEKIIFVEDSKIYYRSNIPSSISQSRNENALLSELNSYILYVEACNSKLETNLNLKKSLANNYLRFMYHYHKDFPLITKLAQHEFEKLKIGRLWKIGGRKFKLVASIVGFQNALRISSIFSKLSHFNCLLKVRLH